MEVYNEKIYDLLTEMRGESLEVHQNANGGVYVANLVEEEVFTPDDVESVLARGDAHRSVASTAMNTDSSRSHLLMQMTVTGLNTISKVATTGKLTLVDLAGSERVAKSEAAGARLVEAAAINKSLSALGHVCLPQRRCRVGSLVFLFLFFCFCLCVNTNMSFFSIRCSNPWLQTPRTFRTGIRSSRTCCRCLEGARIVSRRAVACLFLSVHTSDIFAMYILVYYYYYYYYYY